MQKDYRNYIQLREEIEGKEQQEFINAQPFDKQALLPKTLMYKDIDENFKQWVEEKLKITSSDGKEFPTMTLYTTQRFSEYSQSWKYTDTNNNLLLNFKTITRENNPQFGHIQNNYWNIPQQNKYYTIKKQIVMDDNGSESFLIMKMRQPTAIDLSYKLSIFTTQYSSINEFNTKVNQLFNSKQCYLQPNGYYIPMILDGIADESSYNIDDRQFYGQSYNIKIMAYIITEEDLRVEETPLKTGSYIPLENNSKKIPQIEIEECEDDNTNNLIITIPDKCLRTNASFTMQGDAMYNEATLDNLFNNYKIFKNGEIIDKKFPLTFNENDKIKILLSKQIKTEQAIFTLLGKKI